ncbi:hypothetical protein DM02DRAFT_650845 [Periconia macrospinosa]|uniref:Uncharacterized protein n=1 Tax=Periconia macrospinosa TaxID=97972 RepID=A0A2V1E3S0_9PLEO|nr:hypothetical protein DM02DRAFT_650845 [Periconia macrospinosa]
MNWTGGSLHRLKNTKNGIVQKQKAHFARARARLQSGSRRSSPPVPPTYLAADEELEHRWPPALKSNISRPHDKTDQPGNIRPSASPVDQDHGDAAHAYSPREGSPDLFSDSKEENSTPVARLTHERKRKREHGNANSADTLSARKMMLLRQQDWAGLTRSKPAELHVQSFTDKEMIGKRRKKDKPPQIIVNRPGVPRQRMESRAEQLPVSASLPNEDIDIRFGTDAVTTQLSPARSPPSSAHDSFATMLFDNDHWCTSASAETRSARVADQGSVGGFAQPSMRRNAMQNVRADGMDIASVVPLDSGKGFKTVHCDPRTPKLIGNSVVTEPCRTQADNLPNRRVAQQLRGTPRPLGLVRDRTSASPPLGEGNVFQSDLIGEMSHANAPTNAELCENGKDAEQFRVSMPLSDPHPGSDDCVWKSFLPEDDSSSTSSKIDASRPDEAHYYHTQQHPKGTIAAPVSWSQKATQGDGTEADLAPRVSTSLPSITPYPDKHMKTNAPGNGRLSGDLSQAQWDHNEGVGEDEMLWKPYVFGDNDTATCGSEVEDAEIVEKMDNMTRSMGKIAACNTVSSLSSSPFRLLPGLTARASDSAQDAAARAPFSTSSRSTLPVITSPGAGIYRTSISKEKLYGIDLEEPLSGQFDFEQPPMIRTSIQNNRSSGTGDPSPTSNSDL